MSPKKQKNVALLSAAEHRKQHPELYSDEVTNAVVEETPKQSKKRKSEAAAAATSASGEPGFTKQLREEADTVIRVVSKREKKREKKRMEKRVAQSIGLSRWPEIRLRDVKNTLRALTVEQRASLSRRANCSGVSVTIGFSGKSDMLNDVYAIDRLTSLIINGRFFNKTITLDDDALFNPEERLAPGGLSGSAMTVMMRAWKRLDKRARKKRKGSLMLAGTSAWSDDV